MIPQLHSKRVIYAAIKVNDRREIAYHEAGHVLMARLNALPLEEVEIQKTLGRVVHRTKTRDLYSVGSTALRAANYLPYVRDCRRRGIEPLSPARWGEARARMVLGGLASVSIYTGKVPRDAEHDWNDANRSLPFAHEAAGGRARFKRKPLLSVLWREVMRTLNALWFVVEALAEALMKRGRLTGGEVEAVIRRAILER